MIWALLALLGVPFWLIGVGLGLTLLNRRRVKARPGVFRCKIRITSGSVPGLRERWPRSSSYAFWVRDVLVVRAGLALVRTRVLAMTSAFGEIDTRPRAELKRFGPEAAVLTFALEEGCAIEVAAPASADALLVGPYLLAERKAAVAAASVPPEDGGH
jgi:hypothetical protein